MLRILDAGLPLCDGLSRREWLRIGGIGLGALSLPGLIGQARATPTKLPGKAKSVILFGLLGGPPQHDTWDPKPNAPAEIRGPFGQIASRTPGLFVGELMPKLSHLTDKIAVLRAVVTNDNAHSSSGYQMLTGFPHQPMNAESATARPPNVHPCMGAIVRYLQPGNGKLPSGITIPEHIWNDGNFPWPGQDAGILGVRHNPWLIPCDPSSATFQVPDLTLHTDVPSLRFEERRSLLQQMNQHYDGLQRSGALEAQTANTQKAFELLSGSAARKAFDLNDETPALRDRYGRHRVGQSLLLARRLVEAGVSLVQVNWTRIKGALNQGGWDTHAKHAEACKTFLMPMMDQCFSTLLEDLSERGLLDETLVVWFGEFGHTPRINGAAGRDHWGHVFSIALAGGGIKGGVVYGASDKIGGFPMEGRVSGADIIATVFHCLGYTPETELLDTQNRPIPISRGEVIRAIV
jgi:hypothetical protein